MNRFKRVLLWAVLIAILLLALLSIYGAFVGAERAQAFFNSAPLAVYWFALTALLVVGLALFRRLRRAPSLLLMHVGCILVLGGGLWGSKGGHAIQKQLFGSERIVKGYMPILERTQENQVRLDDSNDVAPLPFSIRLRDFRMEYYEPGHLFIQSRGGKTWKMPAQAGRELSLGDGLGTVTIERVFKNLKVDISGDEPVYYDAPAGSNPALEIAQERPDTSTGKRYVFERSAGHVNPNDPLVMMYRRTVSDYISELEIVKDGKVVAAKDIEVNHPLHYGGYHFYQSSYGEDRLGEYTVLSIVSDSGLNLVYAGYAMLIAGMFWHFWGRRALSRLKDRQSARDVTTDMLRPSEPHPEGRAAHGD